MKKMEQKPVSREAELHVYIHQAAEMVERIATFKHDEETSCALGNSVL